MRHLVLPMALLAGLAFSTAGVAAADGKALSQACTSCHGVGGISQGDIPSLGGRPADELAQLMTAFRDGKGDSTIMGRLMRGYSDDEIAALADYFSTASTSK